MPEELAIELFSTIVPPFDISGNALVTVKKSPFTLTSNCASKNASSTCSAGAKRAMPALAKRTSRRPNRCWTVAYSRSRSTRLATSPRTPIARGPSSFRALSRVSCVRPVMTTLAPSSMKRRALANPMPVVPPVTTATLSLSFLVMMVSLSALGDLGGEPIGQQCSRIVPCFGGRALGSAQRVEDELGGPPGFLGGEGSTRPGQHAGDHEEDELSQVAGGPVGAERSRGLSPLDQFREHVDDPRVVRGEELDHSGIVRSQLDGRVHGETPALAAGAAAREVGEECLESGLRFSRRERTEPLVALVQVTLQRGQEQRALVLPGLVDASLLEPHGIHQVGHRGSLVATVPEHLDGGVEGLVDLEGAGARHGGEEIVQQASG